MEQVTIDIGNISLFPFVKCEQYYFHHIKEFDMKVSDTVQYLNQII